jgi:hypothetical protein
MSDISLIIRTADKARKAEITVADTQTCGDLIQAAVDNWALPKETDYSVTNVSKSPPQTLNLSTSLSKAGVASGETLEIQPVLVAGGIHIGD